MTHDDAINSRPLPQEPVAVRVVAGGDYSNFQVFSRFVEDKVGLEPSYTSFLVQIHGMLSVGD